ncbi:MAG: M23 family metallopeptidase, partial [Saprospiraceae bacterium]|nr:M23 family metallopeptidase [Saprospiraceae bacterium]
MKALKITAVLREINLTFLFCTITASLLTAQHMSSQGGGEYLSEKVTCLPSQDRFQIEQMLSANHQMLKQRGKLLEPATNNNVIVTLDWPLRKKSALEFNSYYATNNFVDQKSDPGLLDYHCQSRTYDGHRGSDFDTWPFPWYIYENNLVEVVSAASGIIIGKTDGNDDDHCSCYGTWNAIYIQHSDGSVAWYGHLKKNSLTTKIVGDLVSRGEYLGVVASSGCSTQPHLHLEIYDQDNQLIDPYQGVCNYLNVTSWWSTQRAYREPTLNAILTHDSLPVHGCPETQENPHLSTVFMEGDPVYMALYFHDEIIGDTTTLRIRRPDGTIWNSWTHYSPNTYTKSWWWWLWYIGSNEQFGTWTFEADYRGQIHTKTFEYIDSASLCTVTNTAESGPGSLRNGIQCIDSSDTLYFDPTMINAEIHLDSVIIIDKNLTIYAAPDQDILIFGTDLV